MVPSTAHSHRHTDMQTDLFCVLECNAVELSNKVREEGSKGVALSPHSYGLHHPCVAQLLHNKLRVKHERLLLLVWLDTPAPPNSTTCLLNARTHTHIHTHITHSYMHTLLHAHTLTCTHSTQHTHTHSYTHHTLTCTHTTQHTHTHTDTHTHTHTHSAPYEMWRSCTKPFHQQLQRLSEVRGHSLSLPPSSPSLSLLSSLLHGEGFRLLSTNGGSPKCGHLSDSTCLTAHCKEETDHNKFGRATISECTTLHVPSSQHGLVSQCCVCCLRFVEEHVYLQSNRQKNR